MSRMWEHHHKVKYCVLTMAMFGHVDVNVKFNVD